MKHLLFFTLLLSFSMYGAAPAANEKALEAITVTTMDKQKREIPKGYFPTLDNCADDLSKDDLAEEGIPLTNITADDLEGAIALAEKRPGTITEGVLAALYYFGYPRALPVVYCAWLKMEKNQKVPVHSGTEKQLLQHMGLDSHKCAGDMHETVWALNAEELTEVKEGERNTCISKRVSRGGKDIDVFRKRNIDSLCCLQAFINPIIITELDFRDNKLTEITLGTFDRLQALQKLNLACNKLTEITPGTFDRLQTLQELYLSWNKLTEITPGTFDRLQGLQKLYLSFNALTKITPGTFDRLQTLQELYLRCNELTEIATGTFDRLQGLQKLDLSMNKLTEITPETIDKLRILQELNLYYNSLKPENIEAILTKLSSVTKLSRVEVLV